MMRAGARVMLLCSTMVAASASAWARPAAVVVEVATDDLSADRIAAALRALRSALGQLDVDVVELAAAQRKLAADAAASRDRGRAARALTEADTLRRHMEYPKAEAALARAEAHAIAGLARLVTPQAFAEIYLQRGLVLHPTDPSQARRSLRRSFALRPWSVTDVQARYSPKIAEILRQVAEEQGSRTEQRTAPVHGISAAESRRAAAILGARYLVSLGLARPGEARLLLQLFDPEHGSWREIGAEALNAGASPDAAALAVALRADLGLPPAPQARQNVTPRRQVPRRPAALARDEPRRWPWIAAGAGTVAATTAGIALWALSSARLASAEALAGHDPPREWADEAEGHEAAARHLRAGAAVSFAIAGATLVSATVYYLWQRHRLHKSRSRSLRVDGAWFAFSFE